MFVKPLVDSLFVIVLFAAVMLCLRDYRTRSREKRIRKITERIT
jgi:hypothetical protein